MLSTSNLVSSHLTLCVAGVHSAFGRFYMLVKDGHTMIVQAKPIAGYPDALNDHGEIGAITKAYDHGLELLRTVVDQLQFGQRRWAFLLQSGGTVRLDHRPHKSIHVRARRWAPLVEEKDISVLKWMHMGEWSGAWQDKEVDLFMAWDDISALRVERLTEGYYHMRKWGVGHLTSKVLGHVVRDGLIVGLMTERERGRPVQAMDAPLVYTAILTLCNKRILFLLPDPISSIAIVGGNVRLLDPFQVELCGLDDAEFEAKAEVVYWAKLRNMFRQLDVGGNYGLAHDSSKPTVIARQPSPQRPCYPQSLIFQIMSEAQQWIRRAEPEAGLLFRQRHLARANRHQPPLCVAIDDPLPYSDYWRTNAPEEDADMPLMILHPSRDATAYGAWHTDRHRTIPVPQSPRSDASSITLVDDEDDDPLLPEE